MELRKLEAADQYLELLAKVYPNKNFDQKKLQAAMDLTINLAAVEDGQVVGVVRILTDGYLFSTVPEIVVDPEHRRRGVGSFLMQEARSSAPTRLFFGAKKGNELFFEAAGFKRGVQSFVG